MYDFTEEMKITNDDLINNPNKYTLYELEDNLGSLDKKIILSTQKLTPDFCVRYILDVDMNTDIEDKLICDAVNNLVRFQPHLTSENIIQEINHFKKEVSIRSCGRRNDPRIVKLICKHHRHLRHEVMESPCRFRCRVCGKKCVHGYTNPDHVSNPFGYLFLAPPVCIDCSISTSKCMWCSAGGSTPRTPRYTAGGSGDAVP